MGSFLVLCGTRPIVVIGKKAKQAIEGKKQLQRIEAQRSPTLRTICRLKAQVEAPPPRYDYQKKTDL